MRPNTSRTRAVAVLALAGTTLLAQGCVVAIGNRGSRNEDDKIQLTRSERDAALVVREGESLPSFADYQGERLGKLGPSTTVAQFREMFPEAIFRASRTISDDTVTIYEVRDRRLYRYEGSRYGHVHDRPVYFRFVNDELESWRPGRDAEAPDQLFAG